MAYYKLMDKFSVLKGLFFALCSLLFVHCSFDYSSAGGADKNLPDNG